MEKTIIPIPRNRSGQIQAHKDGNIPQVLKTAVVKCPGIALSRAIRAILKPPSLTTFARHPYDMFVLSSFSPRARQQYLKALRSHN